MAARLAAQGVPRLAQDDRAAQLAEHQVHPGRLPVHQLLLRAAHQEAARQPRRGGPEAARDLREARHPALRAEDPRGRGGGRDLRLGLRRHHLQGEAGRAGDHLLLVRRGGAGAPRAGAEVSRLGRPVRATTSSPRSTRPCSATARSSTSPRACAARWSCPPTSASTRRRRDSSSGRSSSRTKART